MKILQVAPRFFPYIGGVENYIYCLSRELVNLGQQVSVICANEPLSEKEETLYSIKVKRLAYAFKIAHTDITLTLPEELNGQDFDIIHAHIPDPWGAAISAFFAFVKKKPLIITYHNDIVGKGLNSYIAKIYNIFILPIVLGVAKAVIITHREYLDYSPYLSRYAQKVKAVPLGVDVDSFHTGARKQKDGKRILFLSLLDEFHRYKGLDYLIRAMVRVKKEIPQARLVVAGDGALKEEYRQLAGELGLEKEVEFLGRLRREELNGFYAQGSVFVLPSFSSRQEGFGIVLLEAMAAATPVVATEIVGAASAIKEAGAGIIVGPADQEALAEAVIKILSDDNLAQAMGENGRKLVRQSYDWRLSAKKIFEIYSRL